MNKFGDIKKLVEDKKITIKESFDSIKSNMLVNDVFAKLKEIEAKKIKAELKKQQKTNNSLEV